MIHPEGKGDKDLTKGDQKQESKIELTNLFESSDFCIYISHGRWCALCKSQENEEDHHGF